MTNSISGSIGSVQQNVQRSTEKVQKALAQISSANRIVRASDDASGLAQLTQLQTQTAGYKQAAAGLAQGASLTQVASGAVSQIHSQLGQLKQIIEQANAPASTPQIRQQLTEAARQIAQEIDRTASQTSFNGQKLLDGSQNLSVDNFIGAGGDGGSLAVPSLSAAQLGLADLNLVSPDAAKQALASVNSAINKVSDVQTGIGALQQSLGFAAGGVESAIANLQAASSNIQDTDFAGVSTDLALADTQQKAGIAALAQTKKLPQSLLKLIA